MKLSRITKPLRSVQVRVTVAGELNAALSRSTFHEASDFGDLLRGCIFGQGL